MQGRQARRKGAFPRSTEGPACRGAEHPPWGVPSFQQSLN